MTSSVTLNEQKVISLLRQFVHEAELKAHALTAEEVQDVPQLPGDIASLRDQIVAGNWNKALQLLKSFTINNSDSLTAMKYSICRQRYLESIDTLFSSSSGTNIHFKKGLKEPSKEELMKCVNPEQLKLVASNLKSLEKLCSQEDYFKYSFLISCPDLKTHPNYSNWTVESGRLSTASEVCHLGMKLKHSSLFDRHYGPTTKPKQCNRLLQLLAKGFLYEKCEKFLLQQRNDSDNETFYSGLGEMLDLYSWLEQLTKEAFQVSPHIVSLRIEEECCVRSTDDQHDGPQELPNGHLLRNSVVIENGKAATVRLGQPERVGTEKSPLNHLGGGDDQVAIMQEEKHQHSKLATCIETKSLVTEETKKAVIDSHQPSPQSDAVNTAPPATEHIAPRDIYTPENCHIQVEPLVNSSTPKPSHSKHVVMLPVTSPIHCDNEAPGYGPYHTPTSLRKQVAAIKMPEDIEVCFKVLVCISMIPILVIMPLHVLQILASDLRKLVIYFCIKNCCSTSFSISVLQCFIPVLKISNTRIYSTTIIWWPPFC